MIIKTKGILFYNVFFIVFTSFCWSQNEAPTLTATGNQVYCPKSQINIVTDFNIVDNDDTEIEALYVQISTGYVSGEDTLLLLGTHSNIITSWNTLEGKLTLSGVGSALVSYTNLITAIKEVVFQSTSNNPINKGFSITIGDANFLPLTGHYYEYVPLYGITWTDAKIASEARTYFGLQGYLATLTSAEESQLAGEQAAGAGWVGGNDVETEGVWKWVTGPEAGTVFWNGTVNGSTPNYANWNNNEPNNTNGGEDYAHITDPSIGIPGAWNDLRVGGDPPGLYHPKGYIVEYGGMPGETALDISASSSIYTPNIVNVSPASICGSGSVTLEAIPTEGTVFWFDSLVGITPLEKGPTFTTPILNTTKTYYVLASVNNCVDGVRTPVIATVKTIPIITSITDDLVCDSGSGTLTAIASAGVINWYDVSTGGTSLGSGTSFSTPVVNTTTIYYVDATASGCTSLNRTPVTLTVQKTQPPTAIQNQSFCDIDQALISSIAITGNNILWYASSSGGSALNTTDLLVHDTTYYASQTENGCESVVRLSVAIQVHETVVAPQSSDIPDLYACDTDIDGDDTNGFSMFDLTQNETILLNGKSNSDFTFSYFTDAGYSSPITTPSNAFFNTVKDEQIIYVRIINNLNNTCFTDILFNIQVNKLPVIESLVLFKNCDEDGLSDGFSDFNLNEVDDVITNNNASNFAITYYLLASEAEIGNTGLSPIFNNKTASIVYARVENTDGCFRVSTINLQVSTTSFGSNYTGESLEHCDDDDTIDGLHVFDLTQATQAFKDEFPLGQNLSVHYYKNSEDAQLEQDEISPQNGYINNTPFSEILYVRVESDDNGACFGIGPYLQLTVHSRPEFEVDDLAIYCLDGNDITLTTFNPTGNFTYEWKDDTGQVVSNSSFATVSSGGVYTVIATSIASSISTCESFPKYFNVVESARANLDLDDISIVELTDNNSININNDNNNLGIGDYEFALDDIDGPYQDEPYFDRVGAGSHILYVQDKKGCGIENLEVFILGFPKFFTPNNDGSNDTWQIKGLGTDYTNASKVSVYNRYGKLIKQITSKSGAWDGTFNGQLLPDSDYWFLAELVEVTGEIRVYKGHFSLIR